MAKHQRTEVAGAERLVAEEQQPAGGEEADRGVPPDHHATIIRFWARLVAAPVSVIMGQRSEDRSQRSDYSVATSI